MKKYLFLIIGLLIFLLALVFRESAPLRKADSLFLDWLVGNSGIPFDQKHRTAIVFAENPEPGEAGETLSFRSMADWATLVKDLGARGVPFLAIPEPLVLPLDSKPSGFERIGLKKLADHLEAIPQVVLGIVLGRQPQGLLGPKNSSTDLEKLIVPFRQEPGNLRELMTATNIQELPEPELRPETQLRMSAKYGFWRGLGISRVDLEAGGGFLHRGPAIQAPLLALFHGKVFPSLAFQAHLYSRKVKPEKTSVDLRRGIVSWEEEEAIRVNERGRLSLCPSLLRFIPTLSSDDLIPLEGGARPGSDDDDFNWLGDRVVVAGRRAPLHLAGGFGEEEGSAGEFSEAELTALALATLQGEFFIRRAGLREEAVALLALIFLGFATFFAQGRFLSPFLLAAFLFVAFPLAAISFFDSSMKWISGVGPLCVLLTLFLLSGFSRSGGEESPAGFDGV